MFNITFNNILYTSVSRIKHKLKELGKSFILVPVDKVANNVIARKYYVHILKEEIVNTNTLQRPVSPTY
jgi:hypothetical protein